MPPRRPGWDRRKSTDACVRFAVCLVEPLVPLRRQVELDAALAEAAAADPDLVALVLAGVTSDVVRTLPGDDAWRTLVLPPVPEGAPDPVQQASGSPASAAQKPADGPRTPPEVVQAVEGARAVLRPPPHWPLLAQRAGTGASGPHQVPGAVFGTWRDGTDLVELAWGSPERDPAFVPLADGLDAGGARVLVAGFVGWGSAADEARAVLEASGGSGHAQLVDALRWACWRRRAYGLCPGEDTWPYESAYHWSTRAFTLLEQGVPPDEAEIERDIAQQRIAGR